MLLEDVSSIYLGETPVQRIYLADEIVWPKVPFEEQYLTIEPVSAGTLYFGKNRDEEIVYPDLDIEFSVDGGAWKSYSASTAEEKELSAGAKVRLRGTNSAYNFGGMHKGYYIGIFGSDYRMYGNVMSMIYGDNFSGQTAFTEPYAIAQLFEKHTTLQGGLIDAKNIILPATTLTQGCYYCLFWEQPIPVSPKLIAENVPIYAYESMFLSCRYLREVYCIATNLAYKATLDWFKYAEAGQGGCVFYKHPNMTWERSIDGVPSWMTIQDATI